MKLELKHLAPYLPYGLKFIHSTSLIKFELDGITKGNLRFKELHLQQDIQHYKPILRPLSYLTKEIEVNGEKFNPCEKLFEGYDNLQITEYVGGDELNIYATFTILEEVFTQQIVSGNNFDSTDYFIVQKLIEWHFDVFGLIEQNLAIDINTLNK